METFFITYLGNSGFILELPGSILVFDDSGARAMQYIGDDKRPLYVFVSHRHADHYSRGVLGWKDQREGVSYIISDDIAPVPGALMVSPDGAYQAGGLQIRTLKSTDEGVAFLVEVEGKTIYHAGDLNWWHWEGEAPAWNDAMGRDYKREVGKLKDKRIDIAFVPVDPRLAGSLLLGLTYLLDTAGVSRAVPMHFWGKKDDVSYAIESLPEAILGGTQVLLPMDMGQRIAL